MQTGKRGRILVVEDDADLVDLLSMMLGDEGYEVLTAANGRDGLDLIEQRGLPSVILLDMKMPVMNGDAFAREFVRRHDHEASIVVMTAAADARARAEEIGADAWIGKPFDLDALLRLVERFGA